MLVSTHNLATVSDYCDHTAIVKGTVLACGPTATTFTRENLENAFSGALRGVEFSDALPQPGLTVVGGSADGVAGGTLSLPIYAERHVGFGAGRRRVRLSLLLSDA